MTKILVALSWGHQFPKPGISNEVMAQEIRRIKDSFDVLIIQYEVGQVLKQLGVSVDYVIGQPGVYINTFQVIQDLINWLMGHNLSPSKNQIWIICHSTHWGGIKAVLKKFNLTAQKISANIPYDPNSHQWYTRGPFRAFIGKILHGIGYLSRGEIGI